MIGPVRSRSRAARAAVARSDREASCPLKSRASSTFSRALKNGTSGECWPMIATR